MTGDVVSAVVAGDALLTALAVDVTADVGVVTLEWLALRLALGCMVAGGCAEGLVTTG